MLSGTGNSNRIKHFKEIEVQHLQQIRCSTLVWFPFTPGIEGSLRIPEYLIDRTSGIQFFIDNISVSLVSQSDLVLQVIKSIIDRRCRKHQNLCFDTWANHSFQQFDISILLLVLSGVEFATIAEIMRFIDNDQIVILPVQAVEINTIGLAFCTTQIGMIKDSIIQPVTCNRIIDIVILICVPVVGQFLWTKNQNGFIPILIIFDYR